jgi:transposase
MEVIHQHCAGLDVHQKTVMACARLATTAPVTHELRTFGTSTPELFALAEWLRTRGVTHVAMESTGVYWKPVWHVLEGAFALILANAMHVRHIPGRKSDVNDATWLADLLAHGLIRSSFVPPRPIYELRDLTRTRKQLVREIGQHTQRIQNVLEDANLKLTGLLSDILGATGRAILQALIAGETDPERLASLGQGRLRASRAQLREALPGRVTPHHRFLLQLPLTQIAALEAAGREVEARLDDALAPCQAALDRLVTMPGISTTVARVILAEIGLDMLRFPTAGHCSPGRASAPGSTKVPAGGSPRAPVRGRPGSKRPSSKRRGPPSANPIPTCRPSSSASSAAAAPRRPSSPWPRRCSPPPTTCCSAASTTATSAPHTLTSATRSGSPIASSGAFTTSASMSRFALRPDLGISF